MANVILITGKLHPEAIEAFQKDSSLELIYKPDCKFDQFKTDLARAQVLVTRSETAIDRHLIDHAPELKIVARAAVGVGNIDLDYATEKGILVMNTPGKNTNSAAELTLGLILGMLRHIPESHNHMKQGGWDRHRFTGRELRGKKVGIVGLGNVGHRVAKFCRGFDAEVFAYDPYISPAVFQKNSVEQVKNLQELARRVDILTVHVPKNKETTGMVDGEVLGALGPEGYFVNAARGGVADEQELLKAIQEGVIAGAALDTFDNEPDPLGELVRHEKVWVSPHIGASTLEAQLAIGKTVVEQVKKALEGAVVDYHVNLPDIGVIDSPVIKSYSTLAEKLGSMVGQIIDFNPSHVRFKYRGDIAEMDNSLIKLSFMKGYASQVVDGFVSFVNASNEFDKLGIQCDEDADPDFSSYRSALKVQITGTGNQSLTIGGVVFENRHLRLTLVDDFYFEVEPRGHMILVENEDKPGVIGDIGHRLAGANINISSFNLARNTQGGKAMALLGIDSSLSLPQLKDIKAIKYVTKVKAIRL
ncbi:phosphoglycerate dehydrogenase [Pseudobacteriovorax antillogorgiicola]|uniref:D-3-phosphoglycerate dehydrogenase n=1 Tax=Pseudobacteriovorax antillogorgiicola TaxID=1513793 RepID=A0A1Y6BL35_9BACT|nr:phosphoglycerate dehydrogenase [Pseudobacteriovorax antillogorgiicola]TCS55369.1 D-3-phosphoglycerate dehydrogenase [Pseudobacteriovorax antillogorgiicola]SMF13466.1 D-3-phosphoglycerate dehydrogenase [Pseudobacteriovorax antillogorgiicola]